MTLGARYLRRRRIVRIIFYIRMTVRAGLAETVRYMRRRGDGFVFGCGNASSCMTVVTVAVAGACGNGLSGDMAFRAGGPDGSMSTAE